MEICLNKTVNNLTKCDLNLLQNPFDYYQISAFTGFYVIITLISLISNGVMFYIIFSREFMSTTPHILVANLNVTNLILAAFWIPLLWRPTYENHFDNNEFFCKLAQSFPSLNACCTLLTVCVIILYYVIDRRHAFNLKLQWSLLIVAGLWIISLVSNTLYLAYYTIKEFKLNYVSEETGEIHKNDTLTKMCTFYPPNCDTEGHSSRKCFDDKFLYSTINNIILCTFLYGVPMVILLLKLFEKICCKTNSVANEEVDLERTIANKTVIFVGLIYGILWLPRICITFYFQLHPLEIDELKYLKLWDELCAMTSLLSTCVVPIVFGLSHVIFQQEMRHVFGELFICLPHYKRYNDPECCVIRASNVNIPASVPLLTVNEASV